MMIDVHGRFHSSLTAVSVIMSPTVHGAESTQVHLRFNDRLPTLEAIGNQMSHPKYTLMKYIVLEPSTVEIMAAKSSGLIHWGLNKITYILLTNKRHFLWWRFFQSKCAEISRYTLIFLQHWFRQCSGAFRLQATTQTIVDPISWHHAVQVAWKE